jgi:hypothetical protein
MTAYDKIKKNLFFTNPDLGLILGNLDIEYKLNLVESIIKQQLKNKSMASSKVYSPIESCLIVSKTDVIEMGPIVSEMDPFIMALNYLHKSTLDVHQALHELHIQINAHKSKWFHKWRQVDMEMNVKRLEIMVNNMWSRYDSFLKLVRNN